MCSRFRGTIIGVVKNFRFQSLQRAKIGPLILYTRPSDVNYLFLKIKPDNVGGTLHSIQKAWQKAFPGYPFEYGFISDQFSEEYNDFYETRNLLQYFTSVALNISCLGLFGLTIYTIERRLKEIGIRKALGSGKLKIIGLLISDFLKWIVTAFILALPSAKYLTDYWLNDFAYRTSVDITVYILAGLLMVVISVLTIIFQTAKAASVNPVKILKCE